MKDEKRLEYLEEEREKLWAKVIVLEEAIDKRPSDLEKEAMQASKKASEYRNRAEEYTEKDEDEKLTTVPGKKAELEVDGMGSN